MVRLCGAKTQRGGGAPGNVRPKSGKRATLAASLKGARGKARAGAKASTSFFLPYTDLASLFSKILLGPLAR
jgi:hypothetical protein